MARPLTLAQVNRAIAGVDGQQISASVQLAVNIVLPNFSLGGNRQIQIYMAVAGVQIYIGGKIFRDLQSDAAVPTLESPSGGQRRTSGRPSFNPAIASMQFERLKPAIGPNMSIAGSGMQLTFDPIDLLGAISAAQIHVAFEAVHLDLAVAGMQIETAFVRHMDIDVHMMAANFEGKIVMREANLEFDSIALLMIFNPDPVFPDLIADGRDLGLNGVLFPRGNADVGVRGLHP